ncbi:MAG: PEP-CTERM sorting domain-containing protein [Prosthecobacter sp.]|uniref:PEP-CTERM sorting domain-containing protein n=1 Tax=Prosthecobacter sp. TaxID=1965333 RepID=UPI003BB05DFD
MKFGKITAVAMLVMGSSLFGATTITFDLEADSLRTSGGALAPDGIVMLVADTSGLGNFGAVVPGASFTAGSFLDAGNTELVLYQNTIAATTGAAGAFAAFTSSITPGSGIYSALTSGDPLALLWFPTLTAANTQAAAGNSYGIYTGNGNADGSSAWVTPSSTSSGYKLYMFTQSAQLATGTNANSIGNATLTVAGVPEPSRVILAAFGLGLISLRRRRR